MKHFLYIPFTGLGLYGGHRGARWLRNRIAVFKHFVVPSLIAQTSQDFTIWISWRREDRYTPIIKELEMYLVGIFGEDRVVFTYSGVCFYDDKYPPEQARERLLSNLHQTSAELVNHIGDVEHVAYTIQPSDDCFHSGMVEEIQTLFKNTDYMGIGYKHGYIMNYQTGELREYNPKTNPPFYTIKFTKHDFLDPFRHAQHTALKYDVGEYKKGTPCPSHEYIGDCVNYLQLPKRGFLVGTHGENISTHFKHPYAGELVDKTTLQNFGILGVSPIAIKYSLRKQLMRKLPHRVQRKLRYIFGEKIYQRIYNFLRG
jgi:hypothetical protein